MNSFYHQFSIGFNYWFVMLPLQAILMIAFGASNVKLNKKTRKIMRRDKKGTIASILAIGMDIILMIAVIMESSAGIIQVLDNHLSPGDDPVWSLFLFVIVVSTFAALMYFVFFGAAVFGREAKLMYLRKIRRGRR